MTEFILESRDKFVHYLTEEYGFVLKERHGDHIELLIKNDKESLCRILYRFENQVMKRRGSELRSGRDKQPTTAFLSSLEDAAKACREKNKKPVEREKPIKTPLQDSLDQYEFSLDEQCYLQFVTPSTSQIDLVSKSDNTDTNVSSVISSQPSSASFIISHSSSQTGSQASLELNYLGENSETYEGLLHEVAYGVKYFLVTLITQGHLTWSEFPLDCIQLLRNPSSSEVLSNFLHLPPEHCLGGLRRFINESLLKACEDLDREEQRLQSGHSYLYDENDDWIGGKIKFSGSLTFDSNGQVQVRLQLPSRIDSCRFKRHFGSARFLQIRTNQTYEQPDDQERIKKFFSKPLCILDRQFRLLWVKEQTAYLFEVRKDVPSIWDFYNWHGPWEENAGDTLQKYLQRMSLGFSTSIPGPRIPRSNVNKVKDILSKTGMVMTDGAAPISASAMKKVATFLGLQDIPTAVQARYDGAKGMWYVSPKIDKEKQDDDDDDDELWIAIRDSQMKLKRVDFGSECHERLDILRTSKATIPSNLSKQIIPVLEYNGVPHQTLIDMLEEQIKQIRDKIFEEDGNFKSRLELAQAMDHLGNVSIGKCRREVPHLARAIGLITRGAEDQDEKEEEEGSEGSSDSTTMRYRGVFEKAYDMLLAGFEVEESKVLLELVRRAVNEVLDRKIEKFRIAVERSAELIVIPDSIGVLKEGEIQVRFGRNSPVDSETMKRVTSLNGDVLVTRHPCHLATDVYKVKAKTYPELAGYTDVIIFSTKGNSPLADLLSGGDYDGDTVRVFWEPRLVEPFKNADPKDHQPSMSISDVFHQDNEFVDDFIRCNGEEHHREDRLREKLMKPLFTTNRKGTYGNLHLVAAYSKGIDSQAAIDMAFKFNNSMDGIKTGLSIKREVLLQDNRLYDRLLPRWHENSRNRSSKEGSNILSAKRTIGLPDSAFDVLSKSAKVLLNLRKSELESKSNQHYAIDSDLASRWKEAIDKNRLTDQQVEVIKSHCKSLLVKNKEACSNRRRERESTMSPQKRGKVGKQNSPSSSMQFSQLTHDWEAWVDDRVLAFEIAGLDAPKEGCDLRDYIDEGEMERLQLLLASCLYSCPTKKYETSLDRYKREDAAFQIAYFDLLTIKAKAVEKREGQPSCTLPDSSLNALKLRKIIIPSSMSSV